MEITSESVHFHHIYIYIYLYSDRTHMDSTLINESPLDALVIFDAKNELYIFSSCLFKF